MSDTPKKKIGRPPLPPEHRAKNVPWRVLQSTIDGIVMIANATNEAGGEVIDRLVRCELEHSQFKVRKSRTAPR